MTAKSPKTTAAIVGAIVLATLIWTGISYRMMDKPVPRQSVNEQVAGAITSGHLTIGVIAPLTGEYARAGQGIREGIELAQSQLDQSVEVIFEDSRCGAAEAVNIANKLINQNQAQAIIGDACLQATLAAAPIAEQRQVVLINPAVTDIKLTGAGSYLYRTIPADDQAGQFTSRLLYNDGRRRLAIITDNNPSSLAYSQSVINNFPSYGAVIVSENVINISQASSSDINIKNIAPTADAALFIAANPESAAALLDQVQIISSSISVYGNQPFSNPSVAAGYPNITGGLVVIRPRQGDNQFQTNYYNSYGHQVLSYAAPAYDAFKALVAAYTNNRQNLKAALDELNVPGVTGPIRFNKLGDIGNNFEIVTVKKPQTSPANQ